MPIDSSTQGMHRRDDALPQVDADPIEAMLAEWDGGLHAGDDCSGDMRPMIARSVMWGLIGFAIWFYALLQVVW